MPQPHRSAAGTRIARYRANLLNGLDDARLMVCNLQAHQRGFRANHALERVR